MNDYIERQAAIKLLDAVPYDEDTWSDEYSNGYYFRAKKDKAAIESVPSADLEEVMICGYPARHLAFVATVMQKEGVPPEEVASCLRDIGRMVGMVMAEQKEIIEKTWKEWGSV